MEIEIKDLTKCVHKIAFSIALGWGLGKFAAKVVECTACEIAKRSLAALANNGDVWAQEFCRKHSIKYTHKCTDGKSCDAKEKE